MIRETSVQMFVLMAQPNMSTPAKPGSETEKSESPITSASQSSLILGCAGSPNRLCGSLVRV